MMEALLIRVPVLTIIT